MKYILIVLAVVLFFGSCKKDSPTPMGELELVFSYTVDVPELSGLSFGPDGNTLLTVSDNTNRIYELDMKGNVIRKLDYKGVDLEGVTYNPDENLIAVVDESLREVIFVDYDSGLEIVSYFIDIPYGSLTNGLEGISYDISNKDYHIVNEKQPGMFVVWNPITGLISQSGLQFADDYSGVYTDVENANLWIVSDESKRVYKCNLKAEVKMAYDLDDVKYEGIAIDNDMIYLVNDATSRLNVYRVKGN